MEQHGNHRTGTTDTSYTFEKLKDNETYTGFKMKAVDNAGNEIITEKQITVTLPEAPVPHVGDYVDYQPDTVTTPYTLYGKYSGYGITTSKPEGTDQTITQDALKWQILKIYEDGSMDIIGSPTSKNIYFKGALGYNNGVYFMNDICKTFYSKPSQGIEARSVRLEDFEDENLIEDGAKWKEVRDAYTNSSKVQYGSTRTYAVEKSYYPNLYARENGSGIGVKIESTDTEEQIKAKLKTDGIKDTDKYYTSPTEETYSQADENGLTVTQTYYEMSITEANYGKVALVLKPSFSYWVASRLVDNTTSNGNRTEFGLRYVSASQSPKLVGYRDCDISKIDTGHSGTNYNRFRPVVTLRSSVQLELSDKATNASTPHKITKY